MKNKYSSKKISKLCQNMIKIWQTTNDGSYDFLRSKSNGFFWNGHLGEGHLLPNLFTFKRFLNVLLESKGQRLPSSLLLRDKWCHFLLRGTEKPQKSTLGYFFTACHYPSSIESQKYSAYSKKHICFYILTFLEIKSILKSMITFNVIVTFSLKNCI